MSFDPESLPVGTSGCALHPAPRRIWDELIWVICTIKGYSYSVINEFFVVADSPLPIEERHSAFLFFRTKETRRFESRRKEIIKRGGIWYIERDGKAEEPIEPENVPANMWPVSVELDEQTGLEWQRGLDRRSCLIRVNGKHHDGFFGEVRCDWRVALHVTTEILHKISTVAEVQNQAAIHGGVFPEDWRYPERDDLPQELLRPSMPGTWQRHEGGTPWPVFVTGDLADEVVEEFLEHVNFSPFHTEYRRRVRVVNIDLARANCYNFIDEAPVSRLSGCFRGLSHQAICDFLQSKRCGDISFTNFVILDKHTTGTKIKEPPAFKETFRGREWHCILGDTFDRTWKHLIMVRCAFDSCAEVIDDVNFAGGGLSEYANQAAIEGGGFFRFVKDREDYRACEDELKRDLDALRARNASACASQRCEPVDLPQIPAVIVEGQSDERDASSPSPGSEQQQQQQQQQPNQKRKRKRRRNRNDRESNDGAPDAPLRATPPTPPPERRQKISDIRPISDYHWSSSPETRYETLFPRSFALSFSDAHEQERRTLPSFNLLESCTPRESMTQREWSSDHDDGEVIPSSQVTVVDDDGDAVIPSSQVTVVDDDCDDHDDDDDGFIRLPEATGSTQMW